MFEIQREFLNKFSKSDLKGDFYFTGGIALSLYYFNHRESDDIDLFCEKKEALILQNIGEFFKKAGIKILNFNKKYDRRIYSVEIDNKPLKVEFVYYPFVRLFETNVFNKIRVDSLYDIITNKVAALCDREEEKDVFDIGFFIYKKGKDAFKKILNEFFDKKFGIPGCKYLVEKILASYEGKFDSIKLLGSVKREDIYENLQEFLKELVKEDISENY